MRALVAARDVVPSPWVIGAGSVRNLVWDHLHGIAATGLPRDIDVAYFEADDLNESTEQLLEAQLREFEPGFPWEVRNQAAVHTWFHERFGYHVAPLASLEDAVASWPETATSIGVSLNADSQLQIIAPLGLDDLFNMKLRRNATRVSDDEFRHRLTSKRILERWPNVTVV